jgi:hypothetical protein
MRREIRKTRENAYLSGVQPMVTKEGVKNMNDLIIALSECQAALAAVLDDGVCSTERTHQVSQAEIKARAVAAAHGVTDREHPPSLNGACST